MARKRKESYSPRSASWSLYRPEDLAEKINQSVDLVDKALEETGFNKAVRIREELIRWKTRLIDECKDLTKQINDLTKELKWLKIEMKYKNIMLENIRDILRISREKPTTTEE